MRFIEFTMDKLTDEEAMARAKASGKLLYFRRAGWSFKKAFIKQLKLELCVIVLFVVGLNLAGFIVEYKAIKKVEPTWTLRREWSKYKGDLIIAANQHRRA